ncbi:hypothetical protein AWB95_20640 [Mycobacterium celatum]|uniref:DUF4345 domain-containing protein n=1 Tax=Mycobacterium celatum TaxID=28045 RepID=A0A1X1RJQ4_MYCCE|nr:hypothetical protein AWB95_20640 [Mycobacterium celatum]PIB75129.1 DUF4345 domain-containing protein [Mycobacterium celatum]
MGTALLVALSDAHLRPGVLVTVGSALAGMAAGRILSRLVDASTPLFPVWLYFLLEITCANASFVAAIIG